MSVALVGVGLYIRRKLDESPVFVTLQRAVEEEKVERRDPIFTIFRTEWRRLLLIIGLRFAESVPFFLLTVFALSYGPDNLGVPREVMFTGVIIASVLAFPLHLAYGALSDRVGRRPVYIAGAAVGAVMAFPFFFLLNTGSAVLIWLGYVLLINLGHNLINAVQPAFFTELFGADTRYSGAAVGRELGSIFAGGLTPFIAAWLVTVADGGWWLVATYVTVAALVTVVCAAIAPETLHRDLQSTDSTAVSTS